MTGRDGLTVHTDRGELSAPLDRRRARLAARAVQRDHDPAAQRPPVARTGGPSRGYAARSWSCGSTTATSARATRGAFPRATRCASGSARSGRPTTSRSRRSGWRANWASGRTAIRATGFPTSCVPPSRTGCSSPGTPPVTASRSPPRASAPRCTSVLRARASCARCTRDGSRAREALARYGAFSDAHARKYRWLLRSSARDRAAHATPFRPCSSRAWSRAASPPGRSTITWRSPRRRSSRRGRARPSRGRSRSPDELIVSRASRAPAAQATLRSRGARAPSGLKRQPAGLDRAGPGDLRRAGPGAATMSPGENTPSPRSTAGRSRQLVPGMSSAPLRALHDLAPPPGLTLAPVRQGGVEQPLQARGGPLDILARANRHLCLHQLLAGRRQRRIAAR